MEAVALCGFTMASMLSLLHFLHMAVPGGCPALGLAVTGVTEWECILCFVCGVGVLKNFCYMALHM